MKNILLCLFAGLFLFFISFTAYTFFAKQHLEKLAREFVTEKTIEHSSKVVDLAELAINNPLANKLLKQQEIDILKQEIANYRQDKKAFIKELTGMKKPDVPVQLNPLMKKASEYKDNIRTFYNNTLTALIVDLRIFSGTNTIAGLIGLILCLLSKEKIHQPLIWFATILLITLFYNIYFYVDHMNFFRILFRLHMGWSYPLMIVVCVIWVCIEDRFFRSKNESLYGKLVEEKST